jgi:excisionase family DNA binding protein
MNTNNNSRLPGVSIHLGRIIDNEISKGLTQEDVDDLIKTLILYKKPEDIEYYLNELKTSVSSLFDKLLNSIIYFTIENNNFIQVVQEKNTNEVDYTLTIEMICSEMNISRPTIYNWFERGLRKINIGKRVYVYRSDLDEFIKVHSIKG